MKFTLRRNKQKMATIRVEYNVGYYEIYDAVINLLAYNTPPKTRHEVEKEIRSLLRNTGDQGLYYTGRDNEQDYGEQAKAIVAQLFPEVQEY